MKLINTLRVIIFSTIFLNMVVIYMMATETYFKYGISLFIGAIILWMYIAIKLKDIFFLKFTVGLLIFAIGILILC